MAKLESILDVIAQRHARYNPVRLKYSVQTKRTIYFYANVSRLDPDDKRSWAKVHGTDGIYKNEFVIKGNMSFTDSRGPFFSNEGKLINRESVATYAYDGTLLTSTGDEKQTFAISRKKPRIANPLGVYNGEEILLTWLDGKKLREQPAIKALTIDTDHSLPQLPLTHVRIVLEKNMETYDFWVSSEEQGCCVHRMERRWNGQLFHEFRDCRYRMVDGNYVLESAVNRFYYHKDNIHQLTEETKFDLDSVTFNANDIPDSIFHLTISPGAEIIDRDMGNERVKEPAEVQKHIEAAIAAVERRDQTSWLKWLYLGLSAFFLLGSAWFISRFIRRRARIT